MPSNVEQVVSELRTESRSASKFAGKRIHFIGIGGSGMSGLARMLLDDGAIITGSEPNPNSQTFELTHRGVKISRDQLGELLSPEIDLVVRTAAVPNSNPEYQTAINRYRIKTIKYAEMLGLVMRERTGIAVAGTHGKSTTSAMIAYALDRCGADPSFVIGGTVPQLGGGSHSGKSNLFVAEACEYDRSFHNLHPKIALITNIDRDHLDCYGNIEGIIQSFKDFANLVPQDGLIIAGDDANVAQALNEITRPIEICTLTRDGASDRPNASQPSLAPSRQSPIGYTWITKPLPIANGCCGGEIFHKGKLVATIQLSVAGEHNLINATMAVAACHAVGIDPQRAADAVGTFTGVDRRMTEVGKFNDAIIVDDYGHHPTEIRATLKALRQKYQPNRLICVFQPHQASRTRLLLDEFAACFSDATETILPDIYYVRDSDADRSQVNSQQLVERIKNNGQSARHLRGFEPIVEHLRQELRGGDVLVTMGAGNVWEIGRELVD
jgi:UDP-N-acetylmuramate--alanine ligase